MKTKKVMQKLLQKFLVVTVIIVSLCGFAFAEQADEPAAQAEKDWYVALRLGFQPYTMEMSGEVGGRHFDAQADLADIMDNTDTTLLGGEMEFGKGKLFMTLSGFYQKSEVPDGRFEDSTFTETSFNPMIGYRVYQGDGPTPVSVDLMAGAYYVKISREVYIDKVKFRDKKDTDFTDAMVGARAYYGFTKQFGASFFGEVGAGGSELQYVVSANLVYNFTNWFAMSVGYKYWYFKYDDDEKLMRDFEQQIYGPTLGVQFKF